MKTLIVTAAVVLFTTGAYADDVYHGLADGNSDLFDQHRSGESMAAVQPGIGDNFDRYWGLADGNPDLFKRGQDSGIASDDPQIYQGFRDNPDLSY